MVAAGAGVEWVLGAAVDFAVVIAGGAVPGTKSSSASCYLRAMLVGRVCEESVAAPVVRDGARTKTIVRRVLSLGETRRRGSPVGPPVQPA